MINNVTSSDSMVVVISETAELMMISIQLVSDME